MCGLSLVAASGGCSLVAVCGLRFALLLLLQSMGSRVCGLSCSVVCEIFLDQGLNPCPLSWQVDS